MKNIVLVCQDKMINKIFVLIAKKLSVNIAIYKEFSEIENRYDIVIIDDKITFDYNELDQDAYSVLLTSNKTDVIFFNTIINKPFLPSDLQNQLEKIVLSHKVVNGDKKEDNVIDDLHISMNEIDFKTNDLSKLVDNIVDDLDEYEDNEDSLTIKKEQLSHGGVLDKDELSKLYTMLGENLNRVEKNEDEEDWVELSKIIDKAIDDLEEYDFNHNKPIKLILNQYTMDELRPLFKQLNQEIIDSLVDGKEIQLQLRLQK